MFAMQQYTFKEGYSDCSVIFIPLFLKGDEFTRRSEKERHSGQWQLAWLGHMIETVRCLESFKNILLVYIELKVRNI